MCFNTGTTTIAHRETKPIQKTLDIGKVPFLNPAKYDLLCFFLCGQVTGSFRLTDDGVEAMAAACPRLLHVDVSGCPDVTRSVLRFFFAGLTCVGDVGVGLHG